MVEYVIELIAGGEVVALLHKERDGQLTKLKPSLDAYMHVSKFRSKERAERVIRMFGAGARLASTWGGYVYGSKSTTTGPQSKVNKRPAYRSI